MKYTDTARHWVHIMLQYSLHGHQSFCSVCNQATETGVEEIRFLVDEPINDGVLNYSIGFEMSLCQCFFNGLKRWKTLEAKSMLYGECSNTLYRKSCSKLCVWYYVCVSEYVCMWAFLRNKMVPFKSGMVVLTELPFAIDLARHNNWLCSRNWPWMEDPEHTWLSQILLP